MTQGRIATAAPKFALSDGYLNPQPVKFNTKTKDAALCANISTTDESKLCQRGKLWHMAIGWRRGVVVSGVRQ